MTSFFARHAWLGGTGIASDVLLEVDAGRFSRVGPDAAPPPDAVILDGLVLPGLVSAHSHCFHRALRGAVWDGGDFWGWREAMYRAAARLDPDRLHRVARAVFGEMLTAGVTTVGEFHYVHHRDDGTPYPDPNAMGLAIAEAASDTGIRLTLIDAAYLSADVAGSPPGPAQRRFADASVAAWRERTTELAERLAPHERVRTAVAAHSVRAVPPAAIETVAATASDLGVPFHIHLSEQSAENSATLRHHGRTPAGLLADLGALGPATVLVHATHLTDDDLHLVAGSGAGVCLCPTTERDLGDGIGPASELAEAGVPLSVGTDSNAVVDGFEEIRSIEMHDRLRLRRRGVHPPESLLTAGSAGGAAALGWDGGRIVPGARADFVVLDSDSSTLTATPLTPAGVVSAATAGDVTATYVDGVRVAAPTPDADVLVELRT